MNLNQLQTKTGKPIIGSNTRLPIHTLPVDLRIKKLKNKLGMSNLTSSDDRWDNIRNECKRVLEVA